MKAAIVVDQLGDSLMSSEEQVEFWKIMFGRIFEEEIEWEVADNPLQAGRVDLMLFDWGAGGYDPDGSCRMARALRKWCEKNPSGLALVISEFTYANYLQREVEEEPNLRLWGTDSKIPGWFSRKVKKRYRE
jgi:hypothetical protein